MARLNASARKALPAADFAGPNRSFPVENPAHARLAIPMAARSEAAGNISPATEHSIQAKARAKLDKGGADVSATALPAHAFHSGRGMA